MVKPLSVSRGVVAHCCSSIMEKRDYAGETKAPAAQTDKDLIEFISQCAKTCLVG